MKTLTFDIETFSRRHLYTMPPEKFVRLIGYAWGNGSVTITTDLEEIREAIFSADLIVGHNLHMFDNRGIFGVKSDIPMRLADENRVYDTFTHAVLVHPCPREYVNRKGERRKAPEAGWSPEQMLPWFGLDEQAFQLGVKGKTHNLSELAYEFGDPDLPKKEREDDGYGKIPVDDPRYVSYLIGDVEASREVGKALLSKGPLDAYAMREQRISSRAACISSNGWRVDKGAAQARSDELAERREEIMAGLVRDYAFPTGGKSPWATNPGKRAILAAFADAGIKPDKNWPKTDGYKNLPKEQAKAEEARKKADDLRDYLEAEGHTLKPRSLKARERELAALEEKSAVPPWFGLSMSGETLTELSKGTSVEELGKALAELKGQRSLADLALESMYPDGFVHPEITMLQRSGRWSTTEPGLTVWTSRGEGSVEKAYFLPDNDDHVLIEIDLSNADARVVAALSGDRKYAERFEPGADGHLINAWAAWGKDTVGTNKEDPTTKKYRQLAKVLGHGWNYGGQANTLSKQTGVPLQDAKNFVNGMNETFNRIIRWQNKERKFAVDHGYVKNRWGRKMWVEKKRKFTQAPALLGQSGTREIICDAILDMPHAAVRLIKAQIHDALVFSVPKARWEYYRDQLLKHIENVMDPPGGQRIEFPAACGPPGINWMEACHD